MKYRIEQILYSDKTVLYQPQQKASNSDIWESMHDFTEGRCILASFYTLAKARQFIDDNQPVRVVSTQYIDYDFNKERLL